MSYKHYVLDTSENWDTYWTQTSIKAEIAKTTTDGLLPIFRQYLSPSALHLEAGCGLGKWVITLKNRGFHIIGLDNYTKGLKLLKRFDPTLMLQSADVQALPLQDNSIDSYISLGVVEHFEAGPQQALAEAFRVLKPGGIALIEVPFDSPLRRLTRFLFHLKVALKTPIRLFLEAAKLRLPRSQHPMKFYEYRNTRAELISFVRQVGFHLDTLLPKDDLASNRSISLWSDFPALQSSSQVLFELNPLGCLIKSLTHTLSPFFSPALIVAVCHKPKLTTA